MYSLSDINQVHLEVTNKCQARCPMCPRRTQGGPINPNLILDEITLDTFKSWFSIDFLKQINNLFMCGNYGDPIIAKDCLEIFEYIKEINPNIYTSMHTNGSARDTAFWIKASRVVDRIVFGIDGLSDTHGRYRINTDFDTIIKNAKIYIENGGKAEWHMLVFKHNEHQTGACQHMADMMGFVKFSTKHTSRFRNDKLAVLNDNNEIVDTLYPTNSSIELTSKVKQSIIEINPTISCKAQTSKSIYVSANGDVTPCCWLENKYINYANPMRQDYMEKIGYHPNLHETNLDDIFTSEYFIKIAGSWGTDPIKECQKQCGSFDKLNMQFKHVQ